jgi:branched-chain amino acid transport system permease protein
VRHAKEAATVRVDIFLQQVSNALQLGSVYALVALGYSLVYGIISLINFAHGDVFMVGAYVGYGLCLVLLSRMNLGFPWTFAVTTVVTMVGIGLFGVLIERLAYRPLRKAPKMSALITALAVGLFLENFTLGVVGPGRRQFPEPFFPRVFYKLQLVTFNNVQLTVFASTIVVFLVLRLLVYRTQLGRAMRAVSVDMSTTSLMGVDPNRVIAATFFLGSCLAALGGILYSLAYPVVEYNMGIMAGWKAFCAAVIGGIGSVEGSLAGGLILGFIEIFVPFLLKSQYRDGIVFLVLIAVLIGRPMGLFGVSKTEKV